MIESPTRSGSIVFTSSSTVVLTRSCARTRSATATWWCGSMFPASEASAPLGMRIQTVGVCSNESGMESSSIFNYDSSQKVTNDLREDAFNPLKTPYRFVDTLSCSPSATSIELVDEPAFLHFIDKPELDEVLRSGFGGSRIREGLDF